MLSYLKMSQVGPAGRRGLRIDPADRLTVLTGDNGVGKTCLLDMAWWAMTRTWSESRAWPRKGSGVKPTIAYEVVGKGGARTQTECTYDYNTQTWKLPKGRKPMPGLVVYARVDGGFAVWDPARNYWLQKDSEGQEILDRPASFLFDVDELWTGKYGPERKVICNGLIRDLVTWHDRQSDEHQILCQVLKALSASEREILRPGKPTRVWADETLDIPTIEMPYGLVPVTLAPAGIKRILGLAYLLVWAWTEHVQAAELRNESPTRRMIMLVDEVEAHLHPQWQRVLLPALLQVVEYLSNGKAYADVIEPQIMVSTHSPLVMASIEPYFDEQCDKLYTLDYEQQDGGAVDVQASAIPWAKQGDAVNWLVSEIFGLKQARSIAAEQAIEKAEAYMRSDFSGESDPVEQRKAIHQELKRVLSDHDEFWPRWIVKWEAGA